MVVSMFLSLPYCALDIFATGKRVNHGGEHGLEISANFHFYGPEKAIKLAKKLKNIKDRRKLKPDCKAWCKVKCIKISYNKCLIWSVIGSVRYREVSSRG